MNNVSGSGEKHSRRRGFFKLIGAFSCVLSMVVSAVAVVGIADDGQKGDSDSDYVPGELLVSFKEGASDDEKKDTKKAVGADEIGEFKGLGVKHWKLGEDFDVEKALKEFEKDKYDDIIDFAEPNYYCGLDGFPTDPARSEQWGMHNVGQTGGTLDADIDMLEFWNSGSETSDVVVAVLDTGVDYTHPDLDGVMWANPGETAGDGKDNDGNGYIDDVHGYDFFAGDGDPKDDDGHGTRCAGIIAAERSNGAGIAGMSSKVKIIAVKWTQWWEGTADTAKAVSAINYASSFTSGGSKVVKVISASWRVNAKSRTLEAAIKNSGALFVASAGNSGSSTYQYPAAYTLGNIVSVAATDNKDALWSKSNYGSDWVDLGAPGVGIYSCNVGGGYKWMDGTSMAAPHVAGAAALWWSNNPSGTVADTKKKILDNVDSVASLQGKTVTGGRLNVRNMFGISEISDDSVAPNAISDLAVKSGGEKPFSIQLTWTAVGEGTGNTGTEYAYNVRYSAGEPANFDWAAANSASLTPVPRSAGGTETATVAGLTPDTTYTFAVKAIDEAGNTGPVSNLPKGATAEPYWALEAPIESGSDWDRSSLAFDGSGNPAVAYVNSNALKFAYRKSDGTWAVETVDSSYPRGMALAWDGSTWVLAYGYGPLKFAKRDPSAGTWSTSTIESKGVSGNTKGIAVYSSGSTYRIGISYSKTSLKYAEYDGSSWSTTTVDRNADGSFTSLAFDSSGQPVIAYSDAPMDGILKYAKRSSGTWSTQTIASGQTAYGYTVDLELDSNDKPYIVCAWHQLYLFTQNAAGGWDVENAVPELTAMPANLAIVESGGTLIPYVCYSDPYNDNFMATAKINGEWKPEIVEVGVDGALTCELQLYQSGDGNTKKLGVCYDADRLTGTDGISYAERDLLGASWG